MILVTDSATSLAEAPGYVAVIVIAGGATSGYCATGMLGIANSPASRMNRATTQAKIGRSIKNCGMWADSGSAHEKRHAAQGRVPFRTAAPRPVLRTFPRRPRAGPGHRPACRVVRPVAPPPVEPAWPRAATARPAQARPHG